jgi:hypothetical protein
MLNLLGVLILLGGLGSATFIWCAQDQIERQVQAAQKNGQVSGSSAQPLSPEDSRRYTHDVELYYGETGLLMDKWSRWWNELTHGKPLAEIIAVASLVVASALLYAASPRRPVQRR